MAEGVEESETEVEEAPAQASAAAVATALGRAGRSKAVDQDAARFLRKQTELIELQTEHLHEQREMVISHLRWRRFSDRMRALLQVMTAALGLAIAAGIGWMAWSASQEQGLVIDAFAVPPALAQRGYDGQALATKFLDRLRALELSSGSIRSPVSFHGGQQAALKLEIPETGVSLDEVQRFLDRQLGRQIHISGEIQTTGDQATLSVRDGERPAVEVSGPAANLSALIDQAAEQVFARSEPYRYATHLRRIGRFQDALAQFQALVASGGEADRQWARQAWGAVLATNLGDLQGGVAVERACVADDPGAAFCWQNLIPYEEDVGHDQAALRAADESLTAKTRARTSEINAAARAYLALATQSERSKLLGDSLATLAAEDRIKPLDPLIGDAPSVAILLADDLRRADALSALHDPGAAERIIRPIAQSQALIAAQAPDARAHILADLDTSSGLVAADWGAWGSAQTQEVAALTLFQSLGASGTRYLLPARVRAAVAAAKAGDVTGAADLIGPAPPDCYPCAIARAQIAEANGDRPGADSWFAVAARLGPSLPKAETAWGSALLARGDAAGAIAKLAAAHAKGPNFADPLELWGEALMRQKLYAAAAAKFAEAAPHAPRWGRLQLMWGEALMLSGQYAEARERFETANALALSAPDRAALNVLISRTGTGPLHG